MPPRYAYWTIIAGGLPTAFRAAERDELLPTFKRIHEKHPDAEMKYFARGRLWQSQDEARLAAQRRREGRREESERGRDWRPGGDHRDPRQKFRDAKKARNTRWRKERFERRARSANEPPAEKPHGDPLRREVKPRFKPKPSGPSRRGASGGSRPGVQRRDGRPRRPPGKPRGGRG
jgi:hypothetical protein